MAPWTRTCSAPASLIYGTVVTSAIALVIAVPLGVAIGIFLSLLSPGRVGAAIGPLVELLAAIPSVILGLWGILVLAPFLRSTIEPALHAVLGWIPIFGPPSMTGLGVFTAGVILAIMVLPIIASITRDLFLSVPRELKDGALALGATRWEMIRGVVLDSTRAGIVAAAILGLSRALGEAIAVTQVIGAGRPISKNLFANGDTLASRIAEQFIGAVTKLQTSSLFYCALVLLVMELLVNLAAQLIVRRSARRQGSYGLMAAVEQSALFVAATATCAAGERIDRLMRGSATAAAVVAVAILGIVIVTRRRSRAPASSRSRS